MKSHRMLRLLAALTLSMASISAAQAAESQWLRVNGVSLRYQITGSGSDTLVLLPSTGKSLEYWDEMLPSLTAPNRRILAYDIRGVGLSEKLKGPVTMDDEVEDLRALLDALKIDKPVLFIGTAFGASIQMQFAARYPQRAKAIANISPSAQLVPSPHRDLSPEEEKAAAERRAAANDHTRVYPLVLRGNEQRWSRYLGMDAANDPESRRLTEKLIMSTPFADVTPKIQCPVLLVRTSMYPRTLESIQELAATLSKASVMTIESGHEAPLQTPELVAPILKKFIKEQGY